MAIVGSGIPTNRTNFQLPQEVSSEILEKTIDESVVMRLAQRVSLPGAGTQIPMITGDPEAAWVTETGAKTVSNPTIDKKIMTAHKLAVIEPFSNEFRRDLRGLYNALVARLPRVLANKFDATVFHGPAAGTTLANFDNLSAVTGYSVSSDLYAALVSAYGAIAEQGGIMNGLAMSPQGFTALLGAVDGNDRPLFTPGPASDSVAYVLGAATYNSRPAYKAGAAATGTTAAVPDIIGYAGDWSRAMWGTVENVQIRFSDQATLTLADSSTLNLWQNNMFAVLAEIEIGFVAETDYFAALTRTHV